MLHTDHVDDKVRNDDHLLLYARTILVFRGFAQNLSEYFKCY